MSKVYLVLVEDRHLDPDIRVYTTLNRALCEAQDAATFMTNYPDTIEYGEPVGESDEDGCHWWIRVSEEGDYVTVLSRRVDDV